LRPAGVVNAPVYNALKECNPTREVDFMKRALFALAALAALSAPAFAADELALAQSKNCMSCHAIDKKLVGPAYRDVATKYAGQQGAVDRLANKILKGGSGVWGPVPMPANSQVNEAEAKRLAAWVLTLK
jgi:cytochrome c